MSSRTTSGEKSTKFALASRANIAVFTSHSSANNCPAQQQRLRRHRRSGDAGRTAGPIVLVDAGHISLDVFAGFLGYEAREQKRGKWCVASVCASFPGVFAHARRVAPSLRPRCSYKRVTRFVCVDVFHSPHCSTTSCRFRSKANPEHDLGRSKNDRSPARTCENRVRGVFAHRLCLRRRRSGYRENEALAA